MQDMSHRLIIAHLGTRQTLQHINDYVELVPTVYLPSHDPEAGRRLAERRTVVECGC